jgi:hypothetical protein
MFFLRKEIPSVAPPESCFKWKEGKKTDLPSGYLEQKRKKKGLFPSF